MSGLVIGYQLKIICKRKCYDFVGTKLVAECLLLLEDEVEKRLEDNQEYDGRVRIALEDPFAKFEGLRDPLFGGYFALQFAVEVHDVLDLALRHLVVLHAVLYEGVGNAAKGISQVKPGDVDGLFVSFCILYDFLQNLDMLNTIVYSWRKAFWVLVLMNPLPTM